MTNPATPTSLESLAAAAQAALNTPKHTYTVPAKLQKFGVKSITLRELTATDELAAADEARVGNNASVAYAMLKRSLVSYVRPDGTVVKFDANNIDSTFGSFNPKIRTLALVAYNEIHNASSEDSEDFLKSHQIEV